jgi:hypothetical protein
MSHTKSTLDIAKKKLKKKNRFHPIDLHIYIYKIFYYINGKQKELRVDTRVATQSIRPCLTRIVGRLSTISFWGSSVPAGRPHTNLKSLMGAVLYRDSP